MQNSVEAVVLNPGFEGFHKLLSVSAKLLGALNPHWKELVHFPVVAPNYLPFLSLSADLCHWHVGNATRWQVRIAAGLRPSPSPKPWQLE